MRARLRWERLMFWQNKQMNKLNRCKGSVEYTFCWGRHVPRRKHISYRRMSEHAGALARAHEMYHVRVSRSQGSSPS